MVRASTNEKRSPSFIRRITSSAVTVIIGAATAASIGACSRLTELSDISRF
jgi:hypothetical protein